MIIESGDSDFWVAYKKLLADYSIYSPMYGKASIEFQRELAIERGYSVADRSFILVEKGMPVAAFVGAVVCKNHCDLVAYQVPCISMGNEKALTRSGKKKFLGRCQELIGEVNGVVYYRDVLTGGALSTLSTFMMSRGAIPRLVFNCVVDLQRSEEELRRGLRKSYRSLVNWGIRELRPTIVDRLNVDWTHIEAFRLLHIEAAGRETRSKESWYKIFDWVKNERAFLVFGQLDGRYVTAGLFEYDSNNCLYGVSASKRELFDRPMSHAVIWTAMLHAKEIGCRYFELGQRFFLSCSTATRKEINIGRFKSGFGGETRVYIDLELSVKGG